MSATVGGHIDRFRDGGQAQDIPDRNAAVIAKKVTVQVLIRDSKDGVTWRRRSSAAFAVKPRGVDDNGLDRADIVPVDGCRRGFVRLGETAVNRAVASPLQVGSA